MLTASQSEEAISEAARLFKREMKAVASLDHPHILPLFDFGEESIHTNKFLFMVMPFRPEGSLADWLQRRGNPRLPLQEVRHLLEQAADALQHAHDAHIIHQDVKPSNFLMRSQERAPLPDLLLADFGIARFSTVTASASAANIRGTPMYMAPEQWQGQAVPATDQYALGVMIYQLLTGSFPFQGRLERLMYQHLSELPPPPSALNPHLPAAIDAVVLRALAKKTDERFPSILAFADAFSQALRSADDVRATLAISEAEALSGAMRTLTLPGGRSLRVFIPAGVRHEQVMRLEGQGMPSLAGGPPGALILTILVRSSQEEAPTLSSADYSPTIISDPNRQVETGSKTIAAPFPVGGENAVAQSLADQGPGSARAPLVARQGVSEQPVGGPITPLPPSLPLSRRPAGGPVTPWPSQSGLVEAPAVGSEGASLRQPPQRSPARQSVGDPVTPWPTQPSQQGISRRTFVVTTGLAVLAGAGAFAAWEVARNQQPAIASGNANPAHTATSAQQATPAPTATARPSVQLLYTYRGQPDWVNRVAWSPDGQRIASASRDTTVQVWDALTGGNPLAYRGHKEYVATVEWSPDGTLLASAGYGHTVQVWHAGTGALLLIYRGHSNEIDTAVWSPDGTRIVSVSYDRTVQVWNASTGAQLFVYQGHTDLVTGVAWSPDGTRIVSSGNDGTAQVFDATTGAHLSTYRGHSNVVGTVSWSPDSKYIVSGSHDQTVQVWDATSGTTLYTYRGHRDDVFRVRWSPSPGSKRIASGSKDGTVQVWDAADGGHPYTYRGHSNQVFAVAWSPDSKYIVSSGADGTAQVWTAP
jgi:WD40 repeat protein/serine/threonine protein kinase